MEEQFSFGYWLRRQRLARDLRQAELAQQLGIAPITLRKIEADERRPSLQLIARVSDLLGLSETERAVLLQVARADLGPAALPIADHAQGQELLDLQAAPPKPDLPTGTATFLFTDIEGSTARWEQQPAAMRAALARHDAILRTAIGDHAGVVVKHTGDGMLAAFVLADDALQAALTAQRAIGRADWSSIGGLGVRMALHSGAAELRDGDYYGPALNRAARILAAGHGGQILLSLASAELLRDRLPAAIQIRDLGVYRLKDLAQPEQILQAVVPDLLAEFPPLRTLDARRHNLPAQATALIGRQRELALLVDQLMRPDVRLVTLTGPGGTGKTRLALQAAAEVSDRFAHGVWFIDLAPVTESNLVVAAIARTLGIRELGGQSLTATLREALREQELLLLLDNFEQVVAAAPELAALLAAAPRVKALVTSREALHLAGEQIVAVPPLALPEIALSAEQLAQCEAVHLFVERTRAVQVEFALSSANAPAVAAICRRLDGLPLAIELAAARMRLFTPEALLARLEQRLHLLTGGPRDLPARQRTLRDTIAWSFALLTEPERAFFCHMSVFVGGWSLASAALVGECDEGVALDLLAALVDKSLVRQSAGPDGEPRFSMLETIREFALEQLGAADAAEARARHAAAMCILAELASPNLRGARASTWLRLLEEDHANLQAALGSCAERDDTGTIARICTAMWWFWWQRSYWREAQHWITYALPAAESLPDGQRLAARLRCALGWMETRLSDFVAAEALLLASRDAFRECGDLQGQGLALGGLGLVAQGQSNDRRMLEYMQAALQCFRAVGDQAGIAFALNWSGYARNLLGDLAAAEADARSSLAAARAIGELSEEADALQMSGVIAIARQSYGEATILLEQCLELKRTLRDQHEISSALNWLGEVAFHQGAYARAEVLWTEALDLRRALGNRRGETAMLSNLLRVVAVQGDLDRARRWMTELVALVQRIGYLRGYFWALLNATEMAAAAGQFERAAELAGATDAFGAAHDLVIEPELRGEYERAVTIARAALGEDAFKAAHASGQIMPLDQALADAR
jgi:predicted ATPase/class 3 adenylate cyclase/DNA-binding XRE family transcriptional regulator